jgi:PAS domain S-box-containing protein
MLLTSTVDPAQLQQLFDVSPDALIASNELGKIVFANRKVESLFGYSRDELEQKPVSSLLAHRFLGVSAGTPSAENPLPPIWEENGQWLLGLRKNGGEFPAELALSSIFGESGPLTVVSIRDTTTRPAPASAAQESDESFRLLIHCVKDYAILRLDVDGRVTSWNEGAQRIKGYQPEEILGRHFSAFYALEDIATRKPWRELEIAAREGRFEDEGWRLRKNGSRFLANVVITPLRDPSGVLQGYCKITRDITERREAEQYLVDLADALRQSEQTDLSRLHQLKLKDQFLSHVSHELRSPLASIYSFSTILADGLAGSTNPKQDQYLSIILKNVRQLQAMIEDLLEVTHAESGVLRLEPQRTSAFEDATYAIETLRGAGGAKGIVLSLQAPPDLPPAYCDGVRLRQVLTILLDNAIKFSPINAQVTVSISPFERAPDFLLIEVADCGCGMSQEATSRVFERLYQEPEQVKEGRRGLGLGLYIARELVTRMGGQIWVESERYKGSRFFVTVPVFSLETLLTPVLARGYKTGRAALLFSIGAVPGDASSAVSEPSQKEMRNVLTQALRPDADILLPDICSDQDPNQLFVVSYARLDSVAILSERILTSLQNSESLREEGVQFSVAHCVLQSTQEQAATLREDYRSLVAAETQSRVEQLCRRRSEPR